MTGSADPSRSDQTQPGASQTSGAPAQPEKTGRAARLSMMASIVETLKYVDRIAQDKTIVVRTQDHVSNSLVTFSLLIGVTIIALSFFGFERHIGLCFVIADLLFLASLLFFIGGRFGVIRAMQPRYALICCQLLFGIAIFSFMLAISVAVLVGISSGLLAR